MLKNQVPINTIEITQKAASKVKQFAHEKSMAKFGLKVSVKGGGCSGLTYVLDIVEGHDEEDKIIISSGIEVYIPKKAFVFFQRGNPTEPDATQLSSRLPREVLTLS